MNNHCWYNLNISTQDCFRTDFELPKSIEQEQIWRFKVEEIFKPEWIEYAHSSGLPIQVVLIFYKDSFASSVKAHIDISRTAPEIVITNFGINWAYGGTGSTMSWYDYIEQNADPVSTHRDGTKFKSFEFDTLKKIESVSISDKMTLVNTSIPHGVEMGPESRYCISVRTLVNDNCEWEEMVEKMRDIGLLVERI